MINWKVLREEHLLIAEITRRAILMAKETPIEFMELNMDITAAHANGCPLKLAELKDAPDFDFADDVFGIHRHINRTNGQLEHCFLPRFALDDAIRKAKGEL